VAAERERREQERFTEKIFGSVDTWITLLDDRGRTVFWNAAAERLSGISAEEALSGGFDFRDIFCPGEQHREDVAKKMDACRRGEIPEIRMDTCVNSRDGSPRCVEWTIRRWDFEDVGDKGLLLLGRDVTEARCMEDDFQESESRYAAAFRESQAPMFIVDPDSGTIFDCNDAALSFYGYSRKEMTGLKNTAFNTSPPEELLRKMQNAKARRMNRFLSSHRLKNGEIRSVEVYSSPMLYNGKTYLYSIIHDITEKQRLEEELRSLSIDSALQAKILRSILENSSDYLYVFDREGNFRFVGKKGAELFKRTPEEMAGLSWKQLGIPEKRVAPLNEHLKQVFSTGKTKNGMIVLPAPRGDTPLEYSLNPTFGEDGGVETVFCSMRAVP
jgi:PAS domain S-box-containing protein